MSLEEPVFPTLSRGSRPGESCLQVRRPRCRRPAGLRGGGGGACLPTPAVQGQECPVGQGGWRSLCDPQTGRTGLEEAGGSGGSTGPWEGRGSELVGRAALGSDENSSLA